MEIGTTTLEMH